MKKYQNEQRLPNQLTEQHTNNEVENYNYWMMLKVYSDEKKISSKAFLDQIHQRLYLEQSLLVERIKKYYNRQLRTSRTDNPKLNQLHVFINTDFSIMPNFTEKAFLRVDLNDMINALPKQLHQRLYLEQSLLVERIKKYYNRQLSEQVTTIQN